ncbi:hypothetical protein N7508_011055 [Penicillium antarcticum]|uniref:uncharacterized protein n=1 Tax=Penicillium antarcticum TaxID=416450 RepID=UPI00238F2B60|nr:uncharacterized protein N7508_011055 [Penicillium antarcticum]KAJ5288280.1 hypothetical protein N7508_011055 [Penicillium antarcticum]
MSNIEEELQEMLEEGTTIFLTEKAQKNSEVQIAVTARDTALAEHEKLQQEICQLQQQLEIMNTALQDQVPCNDVQLVLDQAHAKPVSATTRFWNAIDALQNR